MGGAGTDIGTLGGGAGGGRKGSDSGQIAIATADVNDMNLKRMRGRGHHQGGRHQHRNAPLNRNTVFDSNGPDVRLRGTAQQLFEKYLQLGRDATSAGDRVLAESYFQHAEHYFRILNAMQQVHQHQAPPQRRGPNGMEGEADSVEAAIEQALNGHGDGMNGAPQAVPGEGEQPSTTAPTE